MERAEDRHEIESPLFEFVRSVIARAALYSPFKARAFDIARGLSAYRRQIHRDDFRAGIRPGDQYGVGSRPACEIEHAPFHLAEHGNHASAYAHRAAEHRRGKSAGALLVFAEMDLGLLHGL